MHSRRNGSPTPAHGLAPVAGLLKDRAYGELKRRIVSGDYSPGSFLSERQLADDLGMSKTPVKAALERLEHEGFIAVSPQQGIVVRSLTLNEIADHYEIRIALESFTLRTLAGRLTAPQQVELRNNLALQKRILAKPTVEACVEIDAEFHLLFPAFLGNGEILRVMNQLHDKMGFVLTAVFRSHPGRFETSYAEHVAIADAVVAGDGAKAARLIEAHLTYGKSLILTRGR